MGTGIGRGREPGRKVGRSSRKKGSTGSENDAAYWRGRQGSNWKKVKELVRSAALEDQLTGGRKPKCFRCGQDMDMTLPYRWTLETGGPELAGDVCMDYASAEHKIPRNLRPDLAEDPGNIGLSHLRCNMAAGDRAPEPVLGMTSREW